MKKALSLCLAIGIASFIIAQEKFEPPTFIYKITAQQAKAYYEKNYVDDADFEKQFLHTFIDDFTGEEYNKVKQLTGYYIFVNAQLDKISCKIHTFHNISAHFIYKEDDDLVVQVYDSLFQPILDAQVFLLNKKIRYEPATRTYRKKERHKEGIITIIANKDTLYKFMEVDYDWGYSPKTWWEKNIKYPIQDWKEIRKKRREYEKKYGKRLVKVSFPKPKGYMVLNKRVFRHGDTLKIKVYLANKNGQPFRQPLEFWLNDNIYYRQDNPAKENPISKITIHPDKNGSYIGQFILGDSLTLDEYYHVYIIEKNKARDYKIYMHQDFKLEDYELDKVEYTLESSKQEYESGEKIILFAGGKDQNGHWIADGNVRLTLLSGYSPRFYTARLILPDTLLHQTYTLKSNGLTQIQIPIEAIPSVIMSGRVVAEFYNANGEYQKRYITIDIKHPTLQKKEDIEFLLDSNLLTIQYRKNGKLTDTTAHLYSYSDPNLWRSNTFFKYKDIPKIESIQLPYQTKINPFYSDIKVVLRKGTKEEKTFKTYLYNQVKISGENTKDSILIKITNPNKLSIMYWLYKGNHLYKHGIIKNDLEYKANNEKSTYTMHFAYFSSGNTWEKVKEFPFLSKKLHFTIEQPEQVQPSQRLTTKIKVTDQNGMPAPNVNLTAAGIISELDIKDLENIRNDASPAKGQEINEKYRYGVVKMLRKERVIQNSLKWCNDLSLYQLLEYRMRFPAQGLLLEYTALEDTFYQNIAQFSPFIVNNGKFETIHLIYCNGKLKYYAGANKTKPYGFVGKEGYNTITLRTQNGAYTIDSILLKNGQQLTLSLDKNNYARYPNWKHIHFTPQPSELTSSEKKLLNQTMMELKRNSSFNKTFLWQSIENIHINEGYEKLIGPFENGKPMKIVVQNEYQKTIPFEAGYSYTITENRERLHQLDYFKEDTKVELKPNNRVSQKPIYKPSDIQAFSKKDADYWINMVEKVRLKKTQKGLGQYEINYRFSRNLWLVAWLQADTLVNLLEPEYEYEQPAGDYTLLFYYSDSTFVKHNIQVRKDTMLYENFNHIKLTTQKDTNLIQFKELIYEYVFKEKFIEAAPTNWSLLDSVRHYKGKKQLSGQVIDKITLEPLIGCKVSFENIPIETTTDYRGIFQMPAPLGAYQLVFSIQGYELKNATISTESQTFIPLEKASVFLEEEVDANRYGRLTVTSIMSQQRSRSRSNYRILDENAWLTPNHNRVVDDNDGKPNLQFMSDILYKESAILTPRYFFGIDNEFSNKNIRRDFRDDAFFITDLMTDQQGEAYFTAKLPSNITRWNTLVLGMDNKNRIGQGYATTKSFKSLVGQLVTPRFLIEGDEVVIIGKAQNFSEDTFDIQTQFLQENQLLQTNQHRLENAIIEKATIIAPAPTDKFLLTYQLSSSTLSDGEERDISILKKGITETKGQFWVLDNDTTISFDGLPQYGNIHLSIQNNIVGVLKKEIKKLKDYPFECNEQIASRLLALILEEKIFQHQQKSSFNKNIIKKAIKQLEKTQNKDGSWGWWKDGKASVWITIHVMNVLHEANQAGFLRRNADIYEDGKEYLSTHFEIFSSQEQLQALNLFIEIDKRPGLAAFIYPLEHKKAQFNLYKNILLLKAQQGTEMSYSLDDLISKMKKTSLGSFYWGEEGYDWFDNSIPLTIEAYTIFKQAGQEDVCKGIRRYFLEKRGYNGWRNTYESAQILNILLPELLKNGEMIEQNSIAVNDQPIDLRKKDFQAVYSDNQVSIKKIGNTPIYITAYQQFNNPDPKAKSDLFEVKTTFLQQNKTIRNVNVVKNEPLTVQANITVKKSANYVMIEIPIPAGCSYLVKFQSYFEHEVHREYFKDRVAIFCKQLPAGQYTFEVKLETRFAGKFTVNAAKVEQMYFPIFYGQNENKKLIIAK